MTETEMGEGIAVLGLSPLPANVLRREGIRTVGDLIQRSAEDLMDIRGFGAKGLAEIEARLGDRGLSLSGTPMPRPPYVPPYKPPSPGEALTRLADAIETGLTRLADAIEKAHR